MTAYGIWLKLIFNRENNVKFETRFEKFQEAHNSTFMETAKLDQIELIEKSTK